MRHFLEIVSSVFLMTCVVGQRQGDLCVVADQPGVCRHVSKCSVALEAAVLGKPPQMCISRENKMIVCCPWVPGQETGLEARCQANTTSLREGDNCTKKDTGTAGVCKPFANCRTAKEAASRGILPQRCDLTDNDSELVCCEEAACPPLPKGLVTQQPIGSKAADYCIELAEKIYPCQQTSFGWTRGDICPLVPGSNAEHHRTIMTTSNEAPYYGRIGLGERENINWLVNPVTLLSDRWVICAAYGITSSFKYVKFVGLGGSFAPQYDPDAIYDVTTKHFHPQYNVSYSNVYYNVALLQIDRPVTFTNRILPACLHTGTPLPYSGLLYTSSDDSLEKKTTMQRVPQDECSRIFPTGSFNHPAGVMHDQEICSRPVHSGGSCLVWFHGAQLTLDNSPRVACTHLLVGLASSRNYSPCTFTHSRISAFIPWIESIVWP